MSNGNDERDDIVISYLGLRKFIGWLGTTLPFVLIVGNALLAKAGQRGLQPSISDYYHTVMGDVFVGILCAIAVFLFSYRGYDKRDDIAGDIAALAALVVAWFPTAPANATSHQEAVGHVHYLAAAVYFGTLTYFCLVLFTRTHSNGQMTQRKRTRNRIYRICGWTMVVAIVLLLTCHFGFQDSPLEGLNPTLWLEIAMILPFGISWLVKGELILKDQ